MFKISFLIEDKMNKNIKIEKTTTNKQRIKNTYLLDGIYS